LSKIIVIEHELLKSKAFRSLNASAIIVLMDFLMKRRIKKVKHGGEKRLMVLNNGEIQYSYAEAEKRGITRPRFTRALDDLIEHGFIDIEHLGSGGWKGDLSLYSMNDRWRAYGMDNFVPKTRPKDTRRGRGFSLYWQRKRTKCR
jgi:hypothetical protein